MLWDLMSTRMNYSSVNRRFLGLVTNFNQVAIFKNHTLRKQIYEVLPKISENLNIPRKPVALWTCAARCLLLYLSTVSQPTCVFISACVSEFWLFSLCHFHVSANIEMVDVKEQRIYIKFCFKLNKTAAETHQMLKGGLWWGSFKPSKNIWVV